MPSISEKQSGTYQTGQNVAKNKFKVDGPYRVIRKKGTLSYLIQLPTKVEAVHSRRLIPYFERNITKDKIPPLIPDTNYIDNVDLSLIHI